MEKERVNYLYKCKILELKNIAYEKNLSQKDIAIGAGMTEATVSRIFNFTRCCTLKNYLRLEHFLNGKE